MTASWYFFHNRGCAIQIAEGIQLEFCTYQIAFLKCLAFAGISNNLFVPHSNLPKLFSPTRHQPHCNQSEIHSFPLASSAWVSDCPYRHVPARSRAWDELAPEIGRTLFDLLLPPAEDIGITMTFESTDVDSFIGIEIRNWCHWELGLTMPVLESMIAVTIGPG
ncbi:hypothetical protein BKA56DRAFT_650784 [Ilyonectria sp. MPI-CAGE-AT-0026]|nr:hypothetical protein BKA56DRAFT_650784 [Ilyonectria sp. MPI-CAGE-AT-0026]